MTADYEAEQERLKLEIEVTEEWLETQETMSAVSYTHLDVYKRQSNHCRANSQFQKTQQKGRRTGNQ